MIRRLSRRLIIWVVCTSFSLSLLWTVIQVNGAIDSLRLLFTTEATAALHNSCPQVTRALEQNDIEHLERILQHITISAGIESATVTTVAGQQYQARDVTPFYGKHQFSIFTFAEQNYSCKLVSDGTNLGTLTLTIDHEALAAWAQQILNMRLWLGSLHALLLTLLLSLIYKYILTRPLAALLRYIESVDPRKPKSMRMAHLSGHEQDELGEWVVRVNEMLDQIVMHQKNLTDESKKRDPLTGLLNIQELYSQMKRQLQHAYERKHLVVVFYIGLENFKLVNERYGYSTADRVLAEVAARLVELEDEDTLLSRTSSSFCVTRIIAQKQQIGCLARKLAAVFEHPFIIKVPIELKANIGAAVYPDDGKDASDLLQKAEVGTTIARANPKNTFQFYNAEVDQLLRRQHQIEEDLWGAARRGELCLRYQLKKDLITNRFFGVEALVRWQHPSLGAIAPDVFIPIAERIGAIRPITFWVAVTAVRQAMEWKTQGLVDFSVAINLSGTLASVPQLPHIIEQELKRLNADPHLIEVEITESSFLSDIAVASANLNKLKEMQIKLSIDDFGTGYSSLSYLQQLPVDSVKLDQSFLRDFPSTGSENLLRVLVQLLHILGFKALCEGVETAEQENFLRSIDCDYAQGYLYSKPITAEEVSQIMQDAT